MIALLIHITIALTSIIFGAWVVFKPTQTRLRVNYGFIAATVVTGTYLIISTHTSLASACVSGLTYTAIVLAITLGARHRLARTALAA